jgi:hypothetical protein
LCGFFGIQKRSCTEFQSQLYGALDQQYLTNTEFQDVYDHVGRTRGAIRGFIKYLLAYEQALHRFFVEHYKTK